MQSQPGGFPTPQGVTSGTDADASASANEVLREATRPDTTFVAPTRRDVVRSARYTALTASLVVVCGVVDAALLGAFLLYETQGNIPPEGLDMTAYLVLLTILLGPPVLVIIGGALAFLQVRWARIVCSALGLVVSGIYLFIFWLVLRALQEFLSASAFTTTIPVWLFFTVNLVLGIVSLTLLRRD